MHDVARLAGVSIKTVSNVMNDYQYIRDSTRVRVLAAIEELRYERNASARSLRLGRTGIIALAVPELALPYFAELADAVISAAHELGLTVLIEQTGGPGDESAVEVDFPVVLLGERMFPDAVDHVTMQNVDAARAGTAYLLSLGCRRIAAIGVHPGEIVGSGSLRLEGFRKAHAEAGVPVDETLLGTAALWHRATGAAAMGRILDAGQRPDAVFGLNDALALGAMHELQVRGIGVPGDVRVLGFDDIDEGRYSSPTLSTIDAGRDQIAETAVRMLAARVAARGDSPLHERVFADFRVVEPPRVSPVPVFPSRVMLGMLCMLASLAAGVGAALAKEKLLPTFRGTAALQAAMGRPVIGTVRELALPSAQLIRRADVRRLAGATACLLLLQATWLAWMAHSAAAGRGMG